MEEKNLLRSEAGDPESEVDADLAHAATGGEVGHCKGAEVRPMNLNINGENRSFDAPSDMPLLARFRLSRQSPAREASMTALRQMSCRS
jgi:hypothetical protein